MIGPTHPYTGGIAHHTTELCHHLDRRGVPAALVSWERQYPSFLHKGTSTVAVDQPEVPVFDPTTYPLRWDRPQSWWSAGRSVREAERLVLAVVTPFHGVPYAGVLAGAGSGSRRGGPRTVGLVHNVLPHESSAVDRALMGRLLRRLDRVVVHSDDQAALAGTLGVTDASLVVVPLAPAFPRRDAAAATDGAGDADGGQGPLRMLFFGTVRAYKGLDVLLRAMAQVPGSHLVVAGDFWEPVEEYRALVDELGLGERVELRDGYVPAGDMPDLFAAADVSLLPYRSGTGSWNAELAAAYGVPSVVTRAGTLADPVTDDVDGLVVEPDDVGSLARALERLADPQVLVRLRRATQGRDRTPAWDAYVDAVLS